MKARIKVLLADDSPVTRQSISDYLKGLEDVELCGVCENGRTAVETALREQPDLMLLDMQMPVMGGLEAARIFRSCLPAMAIILMTIHDHPEIRAACMSSGADALISKAGLARDFRNLVATALQAALSPQRRPIALAPVLAR
ncbi:MAG TPA: response regulator transcription factor [Opitutaceae bacterium]